MIDALQSLLAHSIPPTIPPTIAPTIAPTTPIARGWVTLLGLAIAAIVLVVGLLVLASLRRTRRGQIPTRTPYVDAWAEAGKRAQADPSAGDILDREGDDDR